MCCLLKGYGSLLVVESLVLALALNLKSLVLAGLGLEVRVLFNITD